MQSILEPINRAQMERRNRTEGTTPSGVLVLLARLRPMTRIWSSSLPMPFVSTFGHFRSASRPIQQDITTSIALLPQSTAERRDASFAAVPALRAADSLHSEDRARPSSSAHRGLAVAEFCHSK